ncbi:12141_t:CDS:2 [Entrophospora sp. SA101]|nr:12141_t:CDS:2 [Entrophospora sp. SA101]
MLVSWFCIQIVLKNQKKIKNDIKNLVNQNSKLLELALKTNQEIKDNIKKIQQEKDSGWWKSTDQVRCVHGSMCSRIKESIYKVFTNIEKVDTSTPISVINNWKESEDVKECLNNLDSLNPNDDESHSNIEIINLLVWKRSNVTNRQMAFTRAVCHCILNSEHEGVKIDQTYILDRMQDFLPLEQGNKYSPTWPFRMVVAGSSDSGKTTMLLNLLIGTKMVDKENGSRYILCNDVILIETEDVSFKALPPSEIPDTDEFNPE